jgi:hypothetical protein
MALYVCASTEAYQLLKLPALIDHFIQHCGEESETTLLGFLDEHYSGEVVYDDDWQQDMELPFKTCSFSPVSICPTIAPEFVKLIVPEPVEIAIDFTPIISYLQSKQQVIKIFQPPRPDYSV